MSDITAGRAFLYSRIVFLKLIFKQISRKKAFCPDFCWKFNVWEVFIMKNERYITRMLNGKIDPSLDTLFQIAVALRVEPAELFTKKEG